MEFEFQIKEKIHKISVDFKDGSYQLALEGKTFEVEAEEISDNSLVLFLKGEGGILPKGSSTYYPHSALRTPHSLTVYLIEKDGKIHLSIGGKQFILEEPKSSEEQKFEKEPSSREVKKAVVSATMPGKVVKVEVSLGERVEKNQSLVILEAMKMENEIRSPISGKVIKVFVSENDQVNAGASLIELTS
ncbi:biotin/lipoyl-binding protein [candidate division TA06 bacterium]|nr:biotin/lipoyl-binding protein [candidate division TA06 bacterium]